MTQVENCSKLEWAQRRIGISSPSRSRFFFCVAGSTCFGGSSSSGASAISSSSSAPAALDLRFSLFLGAFFSFFFSVVVGVLVVNLSFVVLGVFAG